jgi:hypothetical protein
MKVFHIQGLGGLLMLLVAFLGFLSLVLFLPTSFVMVLWNATVFEGLQGPEIHFGQAILLWLAIMLSLFLIVRPEIQFQFKRVSSPSDLEPPKSKE